MRRHLHQWMSCRDTRPESLMFDLSVSSLLILLIIVIFTFLGGQP